jgi:hypothetical protein
MPKAPALATRKTRKSLTRGPADPFCGFCGCLALPRSGREGPCGEPLVPGRPGRARWKRGIRATVRRAADSYLSYVATSGAMSPDASGQCFPGPRAANARPGHPKTRKSHCAQGRSRACRGAGPTYVRNVVDVQIPAARQFLRFLRGYVGAALAQGSIAWLPKHGERAIRAGGKGGVAGARQGRSGRDSDPGRSILAAGCRETPLAITVVGHR